MLSAALSGRATIVFADDAPDAAGAVAALRATAASSAMVLLLIPADVPELDRAMLIAAIGPLARECAPAVRIAALDLAVGCESQDIAAAAEFLATADSTTGQVLRITSRA